MLRHSFLAVPVFVGLLFVDDSFVGSVAHAQAPPAVSAESGASISIAGKETSLPVPTLLNATTGLAKTGPEQSESLKSILSGLKLRQFVRDSAVAPVRIKLKYIKDDEGVRLGHEVHLAFVAHASIDDFSNEKLLANLFDEDPVDESQSSEVNPQTLESLGISDASKTVRYRNVHFDLLDKVKLDGVVRVEQTEGQLWRRLDLVLDERFSNQWSKLDDDSNATAYAGFRAWIVVTQMAKELVDGNEAVLIEARLALHEPEGWFSGSNFLRSKLPIALQEAARQLRRKLK